MHESFDHFLSSAMQRATSSNLEGRDSKYENHFNDLLAEIRSGTGLFRMLDARPGGIVVDDGMATTERPYLYASIDSGTLNTVIDMIKEDILFYYVCGDDVEESDEGDYISGWTNIFRRTMSVPKKTTKLGHVVHGKDVFSCRYDTGEYEGDDALPLEWVNLDTGISLVPLDKRAVFKLNGDDARFFHRNHMVDAGQCIVLFTTKALMSWEQFIDGIGLLPAFAGTDEGPSTENLATRPATNHGRSPSPVGMLMGTPSAVSDFERWLSSVQTGGGVPKKNMRQRHRKKLRR